MFRPELLALRSPAEEGQPGQWPGAAWVERGVAPWGRFGRARPGPGGQEGKRDDRAGQGNGQAGELGDGEPVDERGAAGGGKTLAGGAAELAGAVPAAMKAMARQVTSPAQCSSIQAKAAARPVRPSDTVARMSPPMSRLSGPPGIRAASSWTVQGALDEDERAELARLRKENAEPAMERDVLKRSVALWVLSRDRDNTHYAEDRIMPSWPVDARRARGSAPR